MKILILAQHYAPEEVSGAVLASELAESFTNLGHKVTLITSPPNYPHGKVFKGYKNKLFFSKEINNNIVVVRVWNYITSKKNITDRLLNWVTLSISAIIAGLFIEKPDVILSFSPPITLGITSLLLKYYWKVPWLFRLEDLYPDAAISAGKLKNKTVINLSKFIEKWIYDKADLIGVISEGFCDILIKKGISTNKIKIINLWSDPDLIKPAPKNEDLLQIYNLQNETIFLYSGNIGETSSIEDLLYLSNKLKGHNDVKFLIIGEGVKKNIVKDFIGSNKLQNVILLPYQPRETYKKFLSISDFGVVSINNNSSPFSLPSKIFNIMASGKPVFALAPRDSEITKLIKEGDFGVSFAHDELNLAINYILNIDRNKTEKMGINARKFLLDNFSRDISVRNFEKHLNDLLRR